MTKPYQDSRSTEEYADDLFSLIVVSAICCVFADAITKELPLEHRVKIYKTNRAMRRWLRSKDKTESRFDNALIIKARKQITDYFDGMYIPRKIEPNIFMRVARGVGKWLWS